MANMQMQRQRSHLRPVEALDTHVYSLANFLYKKFNLRLEVELCIQDSQKVQSSAQNTVLSTF